MEIAFKDSLRSLRELKDKYSGQSIFILASGPSTKQQDLSALKNHITIGVNQSYLVSQAYGFDPTFICLSDPYLFPRLIDEYSMLSSGVLFARIDPEKIKSSYYAKNLIAVVSWHPEAERAKALATPLSRNVHKGYFCSDLEQGIYPALNIVPELAIPLAIYLGATSIYLLGCDCDNRGYSYSEDKDKGLGQGITNGIAPSSELMWKDLIYPAYQTIYTYAQRKGIKIYNASLAGNLEVFPRCILPWLIKTPKLL